MNQFVRPNEAAGNDSVIQFASSRQFAAASALQTRQDGRAASTSAISLNGLIDSYLYHSGRIDTALPFDELRRRSLIKDATMAAKGAEDFSARIRAGLQMVKR